MQIQVSSWSNKVKIWFIESGCGNASRLNQHNATTAGFFKIRIVLYELTSSTMKPASFGTASCSLLRIEFLIGFENQVPGLPVCSLKRQKAISCIRYLLIPGVKPYCALQCVWLKGVSYIPNPTGSGYVCESGRDLHWRKRKRRVNNTCFLMKKKDGYPPKRG